MLSTAQSQGAVRGGEHPNSIDMVSTLSTLDFILLILLWITIVITGARLLRMTPVYILLNMCTY